MAKATKRAARSRNDAPAGSAQAVQLKQSERTDILVKAIGRGDGAAGYYNDIRYRDGDTFFLNKEEDFSAKWMVAVDERREEIPEETERLKNISEANSRKVAAERAVKRTRFAEEIDPVEQAKQAAKDLEAAKAEAPKRASRKGARGSDVGVGENTDPKRKIPGTDYERHEDVKDTDNEGPEPQGGRASDKSVV